MEEVIGMVERLFEFAKKFSDVAYKIAVYPAKGEVHVWVNGVELADQIAKTYKPLEVKVLRGNNFLLKYKFILGGGQ